MSYSNHDNFTVPDDLNDMFRKPVLPLTVEGGHLQCAGIDIQCSPNMQYIHAAQLLSEKHNRDLEKDVRGVTQRDVRNVLTLARSGADRQSRRFGSA